MAYELWERFWLVLLCVGLYLVVVELWRDYRKGKR